MVSLAWVQCKRVLASVSWMMKVMKKRWCNSTETFRKIERMAAATVSRPRWVEILGRSNSSQVDGGKGGKGGKGAASLRKAIQMMNMYKYDLY